MAILVQGRPQVRGASLIAVNAFREYADAELASAPDVSGSKPQLITQDMLIRIDRDSQDFINAALATRRARGSRVWTATACVRAWTSSAIR